MGKNAHEPNSLSSLPGNPAAAPADGQARGPKGFRLKPGQVLCGDLDMRIDRNGVWYHHGSPIGRKELVRLFSTVLRRDEAGDYWLITPAEVGRIEVEDAPLHGRGNLPRQAPAPSKSLVSGPMLTKL